VVLHAQALRASAEDGTVDLRVVNGDDGAADGGVEAGAALSAFAHAAISEPGEIAATREAVVEALGVQRAIEAAGIIARFDGINRVADATGIQLDEAVGESDRRAVFEGLGLEAVASKL